MVTTTVVKKSEIEKTIAELQEAKKPGVGYESAISVIKLSKHMLYSGITALAYTGIRSAFGVDIENILSDKYVANTLIEHIDQIITVSGLCLIALSPIVALDGMINYFDSRPKKKEITKLENKIKSLQEDYNFSRGYD